MATPTSCGRVARQRFCFRATGLILGTVLLMPWLTRRIARARVWPGGGVPADGWYLHLHRRLARRPADQGRELGDDLPAVRHQPCRRPLVLSGPVVTRDSRQHHQPGYSRRARAHACSRGAELPTISPEFTDVFPCTSRTSCREARRAGAAEAVDAKRRLIVALADCPDWLSPVSKGRMATRQPGNHPYVPLRRYGRRFNRPVKPPGTESSRWPCPPRAAPRACERIGL